MISIEKFNKEIRVELGISDNHRWCMKYDRCYRDAWNEWMIDCVAKKLKKASKIIEKTVYNNSEVG